MSYTWTNGEVITAEKLNQTGGGGALVVNVNEGETPNTLVLDKTWQELNDAFVGGRTCIAIKRESFDMATTEEKYLLYSCSASVCNAGESECSDSYTVSFQGLYDFDCDAPNEYPVQQAFHP